MGLVGRGRVRWTKQREIWPVWPAGLKKTVGPTAQLGNSGEVSCLLINKYLLWVFLAQPRRTPCTCFAWLVLPIVIKTASLVSWSFFNQNSHVT